MTNESAVAENNTKPTALIIDDEPTLARNIGVFLEREGLQAEVALSGEEGIMRFASNPAQVVILDYNLPGANGLDVLSRLLATAPNTRVIMITGSGSEDTAMAALKGGAADYLKKPIQLAALKLVIDRVLTRRRCEDMPQGMRGTRMMDTLERRRRGDLIASQATSWQGRLVVEPPSGTPREAAPMVDRASQMVGESQPMRRLKSLIGRVVEADLQHTGAEPPAVLITGETGTGKELVANALHREGSRKAGPFVEVNCAGIPASLLEAELFGHEKGAFTDAKQMRVGLIESASGGTLFLDEIGDLDPAAQAKLLKVLEERRVRRLGSGVEHQVDVRFVAATSRDLEAMVRDGLFRADLYYRLRMICIQVPALRVRTGDIKRLAEHFTLLYGGRYGKPGARLASEAYAILERQPWHGNVRELKSTIEQAIVLAESDVIGVGELCLQPRADESHEAPEAPVGPPVPGRTLSEMERELLVNAMKESRSNASLAARMLGISRDTLRYRAKKYNLRQG